MLFIIDERTVIIIILKEGKKIHQIRSVVSNSCVAVDDDNAL